MKEKISIKEEKTENLICSEKIIETMRTDENFEFLPAWVRNPSMGGETFRIQKKEYSELSGIIVYYHSSNALWNQAYSSKNENPPDCVSLNGIHSLSGKPCKNCEKNQYGSSQSGKGNACRNTKRLYLIRKEAPLTPCIISVPPTSLREFQEYITYLLCENKKCFEVTTKIFLQKSDFGSQFCFEKIAELNDADKNASQKYAEFLHENLQKYILSEGISRKEPVIAPQKPDKTDTSVEEDPESLKNADFWDEIDRSSDNLPF